VSDDGAGLLVKQHRIPTLATIAAGGKRAVASALALIETARGTAELAALLDEAVAASRACDGTDRATGRRQIDTHQRAAPRLAGHR
jgi:hypothetical protein